MTDDPTDSTEEDLEELGDVMEFPDGERDDDRRWLVLYEEDYDNVAIDPRGNVGVLVDIEQVGEVLRLSSIILADLSFRDADGDEPIRDMIERLEQEVSEA